VKLRQPGFITEARKVSVFVAGNGRVGRRANAPPFFNMASANKKLAAKSKTGVAPNAYYCA